jgi:hypothetical protein
VYKIPGMKNGKELKITKYKNFNIVFGSVNNKHSKAVYINLSAWAEPQHDEQIIYNRVIKDINKKVKQTLFNIFDDYEEKEIKKNNTIVDLDIRESGIRYGKRSFMNCEVTLFLNSEIPVNSDSMKEKLDNIVESLIKNTFENNKIFKFYKKKN